MTTIASRFSVATPPRLPRADVHVNESSAAQGRDLPAVGGQFPTDGDSHHRASISTLIVEALPTFIESTLGAPRDVDDTLVLASLPLGDVMRRPGYVTILPSRFDEQPSSVLGAGFGDSTLTTLFA